MRALLACLLLSACSGPLPHISLVLPVASPSVIEFTEAGALAWLPMGIDYQRNSVLPDCAVAWYLEEPTECRIIVTIIYTPADELPPNIGGLTADRTSIINASLTGFALDSIVAHEIGHSLFNSHDHLPPGAVGIMSAVSSYATTPTVADGVYAARHTDDLLPN